MHTQPTAASAVHAMPGGAVESDDGWAVRFLSPELLEYCDGRFACLVNVEYSAERHASQIFASESATALAPHLLEHLQLAASCLKGRYVVV